VRSPEDDEAHHLHYWRSHLWAVLRRYRTAYTDPGCTAALREGYDDVVAEAVQLAERVSAQPLSPLESVACHSALKELTAGVASLEATVAALRGTPLAAGPIRPRSEPGARPAEIPYERRGHPDGRPADPASAEPSAADAPSADAPPAHVAVDPVAAGPGPSGRVPAGVAGQDFFAAAPATHGLEFPLNRRGNRALRRRRTPSPRPTDAPGPE